MAAAAAFGDVLPEGYAPKAYPKGLGALPVSFFFDNESKNLIARRANCPNVIPIKVPETILSIIESNIPLNFKEIYNILSPGARTFARCCIKLLHINYPPASLTDCMDLVDPVSGLNDSIMTQTMQIITLPEFNSKYQLTSCIFDIDRTIIKTEGFIQLPGMKSIQGIRDLMVATVPRQMPLVPVANINEDIAGVTNQEILAELLTKINATDLQTSVFTDGDVAEYFLGGIDRMTAVRYFFNWMTTNGIGYVFLTNNMGYCLQQDHSMRTCIADANIITPDASGNPVMNPNYNWVFYEILVGAGIIDPAVISKNLFATEMIIYNNSSKAPMGDVTKYDRISKMKIKRPDGTLEDHPVTRNCQLTIPKIGDYKSVNTIVKNYIELNQPITQLGGSKSNSKSKRKLKKRKNHKSTQSRKMKVTRY
jgi:hypothetical protein